MMNTEDEMTGEQLVETMTPAARAEAEAELANVEPAGSEPFRIGDAAPHTELNEDPIMEGASSRTSRV